MPFYIHLTTLLPIKSCLLKGDANTQFIQAIKFVSGTSGALINDEDEALKNLQLAADQGHADALLTLLFFYTGPKGLDYPLEERIKYAQMGAKQNNAAAQFGLAYAHEEGTGVPQSDSMAFKYYLLAAQQGIKEAQEKVAMMYEKGKGVARSSAKASEYYDLASQGKSLKKYVEDLEKELMKKWEKLEKEFKENSQDNVKKNPVKGK